MSTAAFCAARVIAAAVICIATASACDDGLPTGSVSAADCAAGSGATHRGRLSGSPTWTRQNGPHRLVDSVTTTGTITIQAGALVCGTPGSVLAPALLRVEGSADLPVVFTATDSLVGWGGIRGIEDSDSSVIRHAVIRHAELGVAQTSSVGENVVVENTTISRSRGAALAGGITARHVVLDSACVAAAEGACDAVSARSYRLVTLVEPVIRDSRGGGIYVAERGGVDLTGGTITGSRGVGIEVQYSVRGSGLLILRSPVQITGGATIPLRLADGLPHVLEGREAQLLLLGNAIDELHVHGNLTNRERTVFRELPWSVSPGCQYFPGSIGTIRLEAGAFITLDRQCAVWGEIVGDGTSSDPVSIHGNGLSIRSLEDSVASPIRLSHAHVTGVHLIFNATPAVLEDVELDGGSIRFEVAGSRLTRAHIHGSGEDGIVVAADDVVITDCTIEDNARHGVHVESGEPRIERCNLRGNGGAGVSNSGTGIVDARDNWWGAASGPQGPDGDGIAGAVLYEPFRTEMVVW
jgi:hypothetical protein